MDERPRHPAGLMPLFFTEMWERFGYYLMLGILPLYLSDKEKGGIGWTDTEAAMVVGSYIALVYLTPFVGGLLADRLLGFRKTIVIGAALMMTGYFLLAIPTVWALYLALGTIILGNGAFKPNISTLLGRLYPAGSPLKDAGYNIFYMGINIGAFVCNFAAAFVRNYVDAHPNSLGIKGWNAAFCTAGVGMLCGLIIFLCVYWRFAESDIDTSAQRGPAESLNPLWFECVIPAGVLAGLAWITADRDFITWFNAPTAAFLGACVPVVVFFIRMWMGQSDPDDRRRVAALLVVYVVIVVFFMSFHLNTTALNFWARDDTHREPNAVVRVITDQFEEFAENAPPKYFDNADANVSRPAKESFIVVSPQRYAELSKENKLWDFRDSGTGQTRVYVHVTQPMLDKIFERTGPATPMLPEGQPLKLVNTELYQSINPAFVVLFTPLVVGFFGLLRTKGQEPTTPAKIGLGLLINAGAPMMMYLATLASDNSAHKVSSWWLFATYAVTTVGELCLSPMGLSLVSKVSPPKITAFMMGGFFLAISIGNKLSGIFGEAYTTMNHYTFWLILAACNVAFGVFVFVILGWLKKQMGAALH